MPTISFVVNGEPVAKGRPRLSTRGGYARAYTPAKTRHAERDFLAQAVKYKPLAPIETAINVKIAVFRKCPKAWSLKRRQMAIEDKITPITKPDIDNYVKLVLDALNGVFWLDDAQIISLVAFKFYGTDPRTEIRINW